MTGDLKAAVEWLRDIVADHGFNTEYAEVLINRADKVQALVDALETIRDDEIGRLNTDSGRRNPQRVIEDIEKALTEWRKQNG